MQSSWATVMGLAQSSRPEIATRPGAFGYVVNLRPALALAEFAIADHATGSGDLPHVALSGCHQNSFVSA
jgi:hypothetical protein